MKRTAYYIFVISLLFSLLLVFTSCSKATVTFITFNGSDTFLLDVEKGKSLEYFPELTRTGYSFIGWSLSDKEPVIIDKEYIFNEDATLYAYYEINRVEYRNDTMNYDGSNSYERFFASGKRSLLIENKNDVPIYKITLLPAESSTFQNWYITATDERGRDLINISTEKEVIAFEEPIYSDVIIDFEVFEKGRAVVIIN